MTRSLLGSREAATTPWRLATLADALIRHEKDRPDAIAVRFVAPGSASLVDAVIATVTFAELRARASTVADVLATRAQPGDRALLLCPPGLEYVAALFGCFHASVVAVPAYPPSSAGLDERLARLIVGSTPRAVLTTTPLQGLCEPLCRHAATSGADPHVVLLDALEQSDRSERAHTPAGGDLALLQYTSGSTGDPSGVMLTHANLLANVASIASHLELADGAHAVFWLPPYHDMGLVGGILASIVLGGQATLMSPLTFMAAPLLWLEAVSRYRGTFSAAPNFAYDLCVRKVSSEQAATLDLSCWKSVVNGAEPVRKETMDRFAAHFARGGFRRSAFMPAYGLAEATLLVTSARLGAHHGPHSAATPRSKGAGRERSSTAGALVSVGRPDDHARLLIVDPQTRRPLPEGEVGEIWFSGPSVGVGYWGNPAKSEATFAATLATEPEGARFLRTGDLGELRGGELYVGGRIKDLIIVRGQNYHPSDVELAASSADPALRAGCLAAFAVDRDDGQRLVLVAELAGALADDDAGRALFERVRARVGQEVGLALDELVLIERGASLKTSSGKIRRAATRAAYLEHALRLVARYGGSRTAAGDAARHPVVAAGAGTGEASSNGEAARRALRLRHLTERPAREREQMLRELVLAQLAALVGEVSAEALAAAHTFKELGLESPDAVELSARLSEETGLELSPTLCFEHTGPAALVSYLCSRLGGETRHECAPPRGRASREPVAIVGMGCRFPGGVDSPESLWWLLGRGADAISEFPRDRGWDLARLFDADPERPGTSHAREGGFLDAAGFDARFFGIGARQADAIDPQQRLILEVAWEALEDACIDPTSLAGSATAVFAGVSSSDHAIRLGAGLSPELEGHLLTGAAASAVSGRVAYALGLRGAAVTVDTACSSSLVALHEACRALAAGECSLALAGGVTVLSTPAVFSGFSRQGALAADGRCKPFAAGADGTGFSEGAGLLVLERLRDAQERGHRVLALVRGSAVNQDGRSNGFTAPSPVSQEQVIRAALAAAGLKPQDVDAVEAHGTGTVIGDPIEAQALIATYGRGRTRPLWLGSVKSNLGHTQAAAGVAGVMKIVMAMRNELLPKTLYADEPSRHVAWEDGALRLLSDAQKWPRGRRRRRAGVSSFGISGTNAHVILEEPEPTAERSRGEEAPAVAWVLSAKSERALRRQAQRLHAHLERNPDLAPLDVAHTLAHGRARMEHRAAIVGAARETLLGGLDALARAERADGLLCARARTDAKAAFVFGGQGAQWDGMARELMDSSAVFAHCVRACAEALSPYVDWSLEEVLRGLPGAPALDRVDVIQPALWAVMVSLAELWRTFGVQPSIVVGHSQGEIAAAQVAGGLTPQDAARLVALRGQALREIEGDGDMVLLDLGAKEAGRLTARFGKRLALAASNGPRATVVSGEAAALQELLELCAAEGLGARRIAVGFASHSPQVEKIRERFVRSLAPLRPRSGRVPFVSCRAGTVIDTAVLDGDYWYAALREPVRFATATRALLRDGCSVLIEMSPHPVLAVPMQETIDAQDAGERVAVIASLRRGRAGSESFVRALGDAFAHGLDVDWRPLFGARRARLVALPTYPFERERHWLLPQSAGGEPSATHAGAEHPLLATSVRLAERDAWVFSGRISLRTHPWLGEHSVLESIVLPASAFLELALHAGSKVGCEEVHELTLQAPIALSEEGAVELQVSVGEADAQGRRPLLIASRPARADGAEGGPGGTEWSHHARGVLVPGEPVAPMHATRAPWPPLGAEPIELDYLHDRMAELGLGFGAACECLRAAWLRGSEMLAELAPAEPGASSGLIVDPALVDAILQAASLQTGVPRASGALMPSAWSRARAHTDSSSSLRARISASGGSLAIDITDDDGRPALTIGKVVMSPLDLTQVASAASSERELLLRPRWVKARTPTLGEERRDMGVLGGAEIAANGAPRYADIGAVADALVAGDPLRAVLVAVDARDESARGVRDAAHRTVALLQPWLADERLRGLRLVLLTRGAVAARAGETPNLAGAAVWGLVRSVQSEMPGRIVLVDVDATSASWERLQQAHALGESQLALRGGELFVPRLAPLEEPRKVGQLALNPAGTALVLGDATGLGGVFARHLARGHGVRRLLLASRGGRDADGAAELQAALARLGCDASVVACDAADRAALAGLLERIPAAHPLTAVVHAAGTLDNGPLELLDRDRLDRVMAPMVDAAIALDELTAELRLSAFVLVSSAAATLGGPGQAGCAAASAVLDAIAHARRARGLAGQSVAFGLWQRDLGGERAAGSDALTHLESELHAPLGMLALAPGRVLDLFDVALAAGDPLVVPARVDMEALRKNARAGAISPLLYGLVPRARRRRDSTLARSHRLRDASRGERAVTVFEIVSEEVASVVGCERSELTAERTLLELGGESLDALELRDRIAARTGVRLPTQTFFAQPLGVIASRLREAIDGDQTHPRSSSETSSALRTLLDAAHASGRLAELVSTLVRVSALRSTFDSAANPPRAMRLTAEGVEPWLICVPSFMAGSGPHQFARLAASFGSSRALTALRLPGWRRDERAPATLSVAIDTLRAAVRATTGDRTYVLVGYSSGGALAHALAERCEADGHGPAGVVMIDTYAAGDGSVFATMLGELIDRSHEYLEIDDDELIAMGTYVRLAAEWQAGIVRAPALHVRAAVPLAALPEPEPTSAPFAASPSEVSLGADHFTIIEDQAPATASAIETWIGRVLAHASGRPSRSAEAASAAGARVR
jgi:polyketide synthase 7